MTTPKERDAELLSAWRQGDQTAGKQLFARHADAVARFFENKVGQHAEDLAQATFMRLVEGRDRLSDDSNFRAYLFGIARNVLMEHVRGLARGQPVDPLTDSMAALAPGPSTVLGLREEQQLMLLGLRHLCIDDQILLELFYWERLKASEIAQLLGVPAPTARRRLSTARDRLGRAMTKLAATPQVLEATTQHLDRWIADVRRRLGGEL